ncbi:MAG: endonuclease/exonuclease/phosphatase family protein, partial [Verrucomicrobiota bacterium]
AALAAGLGDQWLGFQADHRPDYWANWLTPGLPWEPNGVALLVRRGRFGNPSFADVPLSDSGNHAAVFCGVLADGRMVRCASLHLDSDRAANRKRELGALLQRLTPRPGHPDFLAGDFNFETDSGNLKALLRDAGFRNILEELGVAQNTHPWDTRYYGADNWGIIDHVLVRQGRPAAGGVIDFGLFERYPDDEEARINENLERCGSDHFPIYGTATVR